MKKLAERIAHRIDVHTEMKTLIEPSSGIYPPGRSSQEKHHYMTSQHAIAVKKIN